MTDTTDQASAGTRSSSREHRSRRHRSSSRSHHHRSGNNRLLLAMSAGGAVVGGLVLIYLGSQVYALSRDNDQLYRQLTTARQELEALQPEMARLRQGLLEASQERIPGLQPLEYDTVVPLEGDHAARNVLFTRTGQEGNWHYEFKLVLENNSLYVVWPRIRLYLFDQRGIQVGLAQVGDLAQVEQNQSLGPGEVRSVSGEMEMTMGGNPAYFLAETFQKTDELPAYIAPTGLERAPANNP